MHRFAWSWFARGDTILLAVVLACGACSSRGTSKPDSGTKRDSTPSQKDSPATPDTAAPVKLQFDRCIADWPTAGGPHPLKPSLAVDAPNVVWKRADFRGGQTGVFADGGPILSKNRLAFQAGDWVHFVNKDGTAPQEVKYNGRWSYASALVADLEGNVYYTTPDGVYSLDATGKLRWSKGFVKATAGGTPDGSLEALAPVLGPDGVLYAATNDEVVSAYRASDGEVLWSQPAPLTRWGYSKVMGGGGKALFVAFSGTHTDALDIRDGSNLGTLVDPESNAGFAVGWGGWIESWNLDVSVGNIFVYDHCGKHKWSGTPRGSGVMLSGELLAIGTKYQNGELLLFNTDGRVVAGPVPAEGWPIVTGADGTIYNYSCVDGKNSINRILAYSYDLKELWRLDLGGALCYHITGNVVLDDDGVMYLMRNGDAEGGAIESTQVIAIQTRSPGLADSSWPSLRHDNRGTAWLVSGTPAAATDAASAPEAKDAPIDYLPSD
jgi:outer membrane protein assembly factor BamB